MHLKRYGLQEYVYGTLKFASSNVPNHEVARTLMSQNRLNGLSLNPVSRINEGQAR